MVDIKKLEESSIKRIDLDELPEEFTAEVTNEELKSDSRGREGIFLTIKMDDESQFKQKYTQNHFPELIEALKKLNVEDTKDLVNKRFKFKKVKFNIGRERWLPVESVED